MSREEKNDEISDESDYGKNKSLSNYCINLLIEMDFDVDILSTRQVRYTVCMNCI